MPSPRHGLFREGTNLRPALWFIVILVALLLAPHALAATAGDIAQHPNLDHRVALTDRPCPAKVLEHLKGNVAIDKYRLAVTRIDGKSYAACWFDAGTHVHVKYPDGDSALVPKDDFKRGTASTL
jgi:hypothetical protein